jgi:hypothetical protein
MTNISGYAINPSRGALSAIGVFWGYSNDAVPLLAS